jgi:hypothetical protein
VPFSKEAWERLDIDFFDVSFYGSLIDVTCLPCINGGYEHAADVRLRDSQWRKPRLVKGAERETCITGRNYVCRACERKYRSLQGQLQVVEQQLSERVALARWSAASHRSYESQNWSSIQSCRSCWLPCLLLAHLRLEILAEFLRAVLTT